MEKHNKVLLLGDIHIGDINFTLENELVQLLNSDEFDCIVIGGDTFDPWRGESIAELMFSPPTKRPSFDKRGFSENPLSQKPPAKPNVSKVILGWELA